MTLDEFNRLDRAVATAHVRPCLDIQRWIDALVDARPYPDQATLLQRAHAAAEPFTTAEIDAALARHPRIGERARGHGVDARFSMAEQAGLGANTAGLEAAIRQGNIDYERKFGRVFLIRAAGRDRAEILTELRRRAGNDEATELRVIAGQLREIAQGRLRAVIE